MLPEQPENATVEPPSEKIKVSINIKNFAMFLVSNVSILNVFYCIVSRFYKISIFRNLLMIVIVILVMQIQIMMT